MDEIERNTIAAIWYAADAEISFKSAVKTIADYRDEKHSEDCTKCPWTCRRCYVDESLRYADGMIEGLRAAGYTIIRREPDEAALAIRDLLAERKTLADALKDCVETAIHGDHEDAVRHIRRTYRDLAGVPRMPQL